MPRALLIDVDGAIRILEALPMGARITVARETARDAMGVLFENRVYTAIGEAGPYVVLAEEPPRHRWPDR